LGDLFKVDFLPYKGCLAEYARTHLKKERKPPKRKEKLKKGPRLEQKKGVVEKVARVRCVANARGEGGQSEIDVRRTRKTTELKKSQGEGIEIVWAHSKSNGQPAVHWEGGNSSEKRKVNIR